jgi:hypothetical protein
MSIIFTTVLRTLGVSNSALMEISVARGVISKRRKFVPGHCNTCYSTHWSQHGNARCFRLYTCRLFVVCLLLRSGNVLSLITRTLYIGMALNPHPTPRCGCEWSGWWVKSRGSWRTYSTTHVSRQSMITYNRLSQPWFENGTIHGPRSRFYLGYCSVRSAFQLLHCIAYILLQFFCLDDHVTHFCRQCFAFAALFNPIDSNDTAVGYGRQLWSFFLEKLHRACWFWAT